ncbi:MAG: hypothetical protein WAM11_16790, partial [Cyanobium sp.]
MTSPPRRIVAVGFSPAALPVLHQLEQAGLLAAVRWPRGSADARGEARGHDSGADSVNGIPDAGGPDTGSWLALQWDSASAVVAVGACGLVTRLIAPLLAGKERDPAVVVVDPLGQFAVPLLGGHLAGADQLSREIAALLGGQAVIGGSSASMGRLALDAFGLAWGWRRGEGNWQQLMVAAAAGRPPQVFQQCGLSHWQGLEAAAELAGSFQAGPELHDAVADDQALRSVKTSILTR